MTLQYSDIKRAVSALSPAQAMEVASIAQLAAADMLANGKTYDGQPVGGSGGAVAAVASIVESYERSKDKNPRVNATIRSVQLVSDTIYADSAALQTAFPAASNNNRGGKVGTASSYVIQTCDGTSWTTPAAGVMGYLIAGVSTAGYAAATTLFPAGLANIPPAQNGAQLLKPARLYGAMTNWNNGQQGLAAYNLSGSRQQSGTARLRFVTDEAEPIIKCGASLYGYMLNLDVGDGNGFRAVFDPSITTNLAFPLFFNQQAFTGQAGGGVLDVKLDVSQLGGFGRRRRTFEMRSPNDLTIDSIRIKPVATFFQPPESPRIWWACDSLGGTVNGGNMMDSYVGCLQDFLGVPDICLVSEGGTGFVNLGPSNAFRTHEMKLDALAQIPQYANPCVIVIPASVNDNGLSGVTAATVSCINKALSLNASAPVVVIGPSARNSTAEQTASIATENLVKAGVDQVASKRVIWIPMMTDNPQAIRGTGTINSPTGDGNCDLLFRTGDNVHPATEGHLIYARDLVGPKLAAALRAWVAAQ